MKKKTVAVFFWFFFKWILKKPGFFWVFFQILWKKADKNWEIWKKDENDGVFFIKQVRSNKDASKGRNKETFLKNCKFQKKKI